MSPEAPLDAAAVASRQFATARRGLDSGEVRAYLQHLSEAIGDLRRREAELLVRVERAESRAEEAERLDEGRLVELLGEETTRVLAASRAAAADIKHKAQESAARLISEANDEAHQIRADAESAVATQRTETLAEVDALRHEAVVELDRRRAEGDELVAQIRREAEAECDALRHRGEQARQDAADDAKTIRAEAQEEGRQMVAEAQLVRERMLQDLARRRRTAREQLERLHAARDRLLAAYEVVRRTVAEATTELQVALPEAKIAGDQAMRRVHDEPEQTVDELEAQVSMARIAGLLDPLGEVGSSSDESEPSEDEVSIEPVVTPEVDPGQIRPLDPQPVVTGDEELDVRPASDGELSEPPPIESEPSEPDPTDLEPVEAVTGLDDDPDETSTPADDDQASPYDHATEDETSANDEVPAEPEPRFEPEPRSEPEPDAASSDLDELFARLRQGQDHDVDEPEPILVGAETPETPVVEVSVERSSASPTSVHAVARAEGSDRALDDARDAEASEATPGADDPLLQQRDEALGPIERDLGRLLKRALADEQNEVLDLLRRSKPTTADELLPSAADHAERYADAARDELDAAANWGAIQIAEAEEPLDDPAFCDAMAAELGQAVVAPLRERIARSFVETGGDIGEVTSRIRALYREWKGQRIADAVRHFTVAAYAHGAYAATPKGAPVCWLVDRHGDSCPDADDNALAGSVCKGEAFPTGDHFPPAHLGCRCLVVPDKS
jgi:cell division septum initiation protein DivIVA